MESELNTTAVALTALYTGLAETLAVASNWAIDTNWPDWLSGKGREWPIWLPATQLATRQEWSPEQALLREAVTALADVFPTSRQRRQAAFMAVVNQNSRPLAFHESHFVNGRLYGETTQEVAAVYRQCGLELTQAELPDHVSVELEFLAFLAEQEVVDAAHTDVWQKVRKLFLQRHAGRWIPDLGRKLAQASDPGWVAIGLLLTAVTIEPIQQRPFTHSKIGLPQINACEECTLCGFCTQVCPTNALTVREDAHTTNLILQPDICVRCRKCAHVCPSQILSMTNPSVTNRSLMVLRQSNRAICPGCGKTTISEAELTAVAAQLGNPAWLHYCPDCRSTRQPFI